MRKSRVACALFCSLLGMVGVTSAYASMSETKTDVGIGYVQDSDGHVVQSGHGNCLRTQFWAPTNAYEQCDPQYFRHVPPPVVVVTPKVQPKPYVYRPVVQPKTPAPMPLKHKMTFAAGTFFDTDMATLRPSAMQVLDQLVGAIKPVELEVVIITGYTDGRGRPTYNQKLSEDRAAAVKTYLMQKGVDPNLLYAEGKGAQDPVGDNATASGRAKNRRVDIEVIGSSQNADMGKVNTSFQDNTTTADHGPHFMSQQPHKRVTPKHAKNMNKRAPEKEANTHATKPTLPSMKEMQRSTHPSKEMKQNGVEHTVTKTATH